MLYFTAIILILFHFVLRLDGICGPHVYRKAKVLVKIYA